MGSVPTPRVVMQTVFPWRQGMPYGDEIASVKFALPERLLAAGLTDRVWTLREVLLYRVPPWPQPAGV